MNVAVAKGSSGVAEGKLKTRKKKEWKPSTSVEPVGQGERSTTVQKAPCELCGGIFPQPITYHMRQVRKHYSSKYSLFTKDYNKKWALVCTGVKNPI